MCMYAILCDRQNVWKMKHSSYKYSGCENTYRKEKSRLCETYVATLRL